MKGTPMKRVMLAALIGIWSTAALAHSPLEGSTPANRAVISHPPIEVILDFKGIIRLTPVTMQFDATPGVDLDLSGHDGFISDYAIPLPTKCSGDYVIEWRGLGDDGHAMTGTFGFTVE